MNVGFNVSVSIPTINVPSAVLTSSPVAKYHNISWYIKKLIHEDVEKNGPPLKADGTPDDKWYQDMAFMEYKALQIERQHGVGPHDLNGKLIEVGKTIMVAAGSKMVVGTVIEVQPDTHRVRVLMENKTPYTYWNRVYPFKSRRQWFAQPARMVVA